MLEAETEAEAKILASAIFGYYYYRVLRAIMSASRRQPHLLQVSAVDRRQTWSILG